MGSSLNQVSSTEHLQSCSPHYLLFHFWQFSVLIFAKGNKSQAVSINKSARSKVRVADPSFKGRREVLEKRRKREQEKEKERAGNKQGREKNTGRQQEKAGKTVMQRMQ